MKRTCHCYVVSYVPDLSRVTRVAIGVILLASGVGAKTFRQSYFRRNWTEVTKVQPCADVQMLSALGNYVSRNIAGDGYQDFVKSLSESMGNNAQLEGPIKLHESADLSLLKKLCREHLGEDAALAP